MQQQMKWTQTTLGMTKTENTQNYSCPEHGAETTEELGM